MRIIGIWPGAGQSRVSTSGEVPGNAGHGRLHAVDAPGQDRQGIGGVQKEIGLFFMDNLLKAVVKSGLRFS